MTIPEIWTEEVLKSCRRTSLWANQFPRERTPLTRRERFRVWRVLTSHSIRHAIATRIYPEGESDW